MGALASLLNPVNPFLKSLQSAVAPNGVTPAGLPLAPPQVDAQTQRSVARLDPTTATMQAPATPSLGMAAAPSLGAPVAPQAQHSKLLDDQNDLVRLQTNGPGDSHIQNPFLRGLAQAGDRILSVAAPKVAQYTPGTLMDNQRQQGIDVARINQDQGQAQASAQLAGTQATTAYTQARPEIAQAQMELQQQKVDNQQQSVRARVADAAGKRGQITTWDENTGLPTFTDDHNSQEFKDHQSLATLHDAQAQKDQILSDIQKNHYIPGAPEWAEAQRKMAQVDAKIQLGMQGLGLRAQGVEMRRENMNANLYGIGPDGKPVAGAGQIANDDGGIQVVGPKFAPGATKANANAAKFNDVHGALDSVEGAATQLVQSGGKLNSPGVVAALTAAQSDKGWIPGAVSNYLKSQNASSLTPQERGYVQAVEAAHENVQALRSSVGGGVSDSQVNRLEAMMPGAQTPDLDYLMGQTGQVRATATRLGRGVTTAAGGLTVRGQSGAPAPATGGGMQVGQSVKLKNGKTVKVTAVHPDGSFDAQ